MLGVHHLLLLGFLYYYMMMMMMTMMMTTMIIMIVQYKMSQVVFKAKHKKIPLIAEVRWSMCYTCALIKMACPRVNGRS